MMKKFTLFMLASIGLSLNAQVYFNEDFEAETVGQPPSNFTVLNEDACTVNNPNTFTNGSWIVSDDQGAQGLIAAAQSWSNPAGCTSDDWLITGVIDLTSATALTDLTWKAKSYEGPNYPEDYEVLLSTTGTAVADFSTNLLSVTAELENWTSHTVSLAPYIGGTVYIAFRMTSTDQSQLQLDDIKVSEPAAYDLEVSGVTTNGVKQKYDLAGFEHIVLDFSNRTNFESSVDVKNVGVNSVDSLYLTYFLVNDLNSPTEGVAYGDTVFLSTPLAPGATYTHMFDPYGLDTLFTPNDLAPLDFYVQIDSSSFNTVVDDKDFEYSLLFSPVESYAVPYETSFEIANLGSQTFTFDNRTWGWKYFDNDGDNVSLAAGQAFSNLPANSGDFQVYGSIVNGNSLSASAADETAQSPQLSLENTKSYIVSLYARTGFGITGDLDIELVNSDNSYTSNIGSINLIEADSAYQQFTFEFTFAGATADDYMFNLNKTAAGFIIFDDFSIQELVAPTVTASLLSSSVDESGITYCDSSVTLSINPTGNPTSVTVDWGDGSALEDVTGNNNPSHDYASLGTFDITVSASNSVGSDDAMVSVEVAEVPVPTVSFGVPTVSGSTVTVSIGTGATTNVSYSPSCGTTIIIDWGDGTVEQFPAGTTTASHTYSTFNTFTVSVSGQNDAGISSAQTQDVVISGISDVTFKEYNVYPNPSNDILNVAFELNSNENVELTVVSIQGSVVETLNFNDASVVNTTINTSSLNNGVYILKVKTSQGISTQKFVVSHF